MKIEKTLSTSVKVIESHGLDMSAVGSLLSGMGTMLGAFAVIIAAILGTGTFRQWKRQQVIQRQMDLAEEILSVAFRCRAAIQSIRATRETNDEILSAVAEAKAFGTDVLDGPEPYSTRLRSAIIISRRLRRHENLWSDVEILKAKGWAYFDGSVMSSLNIITSQVEAISEAADAYSLENLSADDVIRHGLVLKRLSLKQSLGNPDNVTLSLAGAVKAIKDELKPIITNNANDISKIVNQSMVNVFTSTLKGFY